MKFFVVFFLFFFFFSHHAIPCVVSIMHAVLIYECMMFDCAENTPVFLYGTW